MSKTSTIIDGVELHSTSDVKYFQSLKGFKEKNIIDFFNLYYTKIEEINKKNGKTKITYKLNIEIDGFLFSSKPDADYYLYLAEHQKNGLISSFNLEEKKAKDDKPKYLARKVHINEYLFDSKTEADYYIHLLTQKKDKIIKDFEIKPTYELQPKFKKNGKVFRSILYTPDFEVYHLNGNVDVIDVKGFVTPDFAIKMKLFEFKFSDKELKLVKNVKKFGGWITFDDWNKLKKEDKKKKK